nr:LysR family transcriptional regulator [Gammaproteobacteria bacterium]
SRRVARLEASLGVRLLERTTRRLRMTDTGEIFYRHCQRMLDEAAQAELSVNQLLEKPQGWLRVSASVSAGQHLIAPLMSDFLQQYPDIKLQLVLTNRYVELIEEGFDVAVRIGDLPDSTLVTRPLGQSALRFYASPGYVASNPPIATPTDLTKQRCIVMSESSATVRWRLQRDTHEEVISVAPYLSVNDFSTIRRLLCDGVGVAALPEHIALSSDAPELVQLLPAWSFRTVEFRAVFPSQRGALPKLRVFLDFLSARLNPGSPPRADQ